jgi:hypothetical protein
MGDRGAVVAESHHIGESGRTDDHSPESDTKV